MTFILCSPRSGALAPGKVSCITKTLHTYFTFLQTLEHTHAASASQLHENLHKLSANVWRGILEHPVATKSYGACILPFNDID